MAATLSALLLAGCSPNPPADDSLLVGPKSFDFTSNILTPCIDQSAKYKNFCTLIKNSGVAESSQVFNTDYQNLLLSSSTVLLTDAAFDKYLTKNKITLEDFKKDKKAIEMLLRNQVIIFNQSALSANGKIDSKNMNGTSVSVVKDSNGNISIASISVSKSGISYFANPFYVYPLGAEDAF